MATEAPASPVLPEYAISPEDLTIESMSSIGGTESDVFEGQFHGRVVAVKRLPEESSAQVGHNSFNQFTPLFNHFTIGGTQTS